MDLVSFSQMVSCCNLMIALALNGCLWKVVVNICVKAVAVSLVPLTGANCFWFTRLSNGFEKVDVFLKQRMLLVDGWC